MEQQNPGWQLAALLEASASDAGEWREFRYPAGSTVLEAQARDAPVCVLSRGLVKLFYPVAAGDEWTKSYIAGRGVFGPSSPQETVAQFGARALEDCTIAKLRPAWVAAQVTRNEALAAALATFQTWLFERKRRREEDLLCLAAEQRYLSFMASEPELAGRLELQEIAAYLRVTPVALSRIRRRLKSAGRLQQRA